MDFLKLSSLASVIILATPLAQATVITSGSVYPSNSATLADYTSIITVGSGTNSGSLEVNSSSANNGVTSITGSSLVIAQFEGSSGTVKVDNGSITLNNGGLGLRHGFGGNSQLEVLNGGSVVANETNIFLGANSVDGTSATSTTLIDGTDSVLRTQQGSVGESWERDGGRIYVNFDDSINHSQITVSNGGLLEALSGQQFNGDDDGSIWIGTAGRSGSTASVTIDGEGSSMKADNYIEVGSSRAGVTSELNIFNGATVKVNDGVDGDPEASDIYISTFPDSGTSTVTINGTGSTLSADQIQVGGKTAIVGYLANGTPTTSLDWSSLAEDQQVSDEQGNLLYDESGNPVLAELEPSSGIALPSTYLNGNSIYTKNQGTLIVENNAQVNAQRIDVSTDDESAIIDNQGATLTVRSGATLNGDVNVYEGGELNGADGTIVGDVLIDGGMLAPGNSPGTLNIDGDLDLLSGLVELEITGLAQDLINISGNLTLGADVLIDLVFSISPNDIIIDLADFFDVQGDTLVEQGFSLADNLRIITPNPTDWFLTVAFLGESVDFGQRSSPSEVSAPSTFLIFSLSLVSLLWLRRRNKASA